MRMFERYLLAITLGLVTAAVTAGDTERTPELSSASAPEQVSTTLSVAGSRGELLYENNCKVCHTSIVHIRENHEAKSMADLRMWVRRWSDELKLDWSNEEIDDVAQFLAHRFYKFGGREEKS